MRSFALTIITLLSLSATARSATPLDYTRDTLEKAQAVADSQQDHNAKLAQLSALFRSFLDTDAMGKDALGSRWFSFNSAQQKQFLALFHELFERTYVAKLLLFDNPKFAYGSETQNADRAVVATKIITSRDEFDVVYRLERDGDRWLATEITVEDVSLTANLGSQLRDLLSRMSPADVLDLMQRKYGSSGESR